VALRAQLLILLPVLILPVVVVELVELVHQPLVQLLQQQTQEGWQHCGHIQILTMLVVVVAGQLLM
jgi:uncharacterized membrane protein